MEPATLIQSPTREVFGNVAPWMQAIFYGLMAVSFAILAGRLWARVRLWRTGTPGGFETDWRIWLKRVSVFAIGQKKVHRKSLGALLHLLLFAGFVVLTIGTTLLMVAHAGPLDFHQGGYYLLYELVMDSFGLAFCVGCVLAILRRAAHRPASLGHAPKDYYLLALLLALGVTGFFLEALRLRYTGVPLETARWSTVGWAIDQFFFRGLSVELARSWHLAVWWGHAILIAIFFATFPTNRFLHVVTGPVNIAVRPARPMGALAPLNLEVVEVAGKAGVAVLADFNRQQLLSLDACMECGRCEDACPAWATGKPLSPKGVIVNLRNSMTLGPSRDLVQGGAILPETLWSCTMCQACVQECPVLIGHVDLINDMRRHLVAQGQITGSPARALNSIGRNSNPFGKPGNERFAWAAGLDVPTVETNPEFEYLLWLGCAASFDPRAQKSVRALVRLMKRANVNFAVLGQKERCTGDPARRLGDEFTFQDLATRNIQTLNSHKVRKIVTSCPHCLNTIKNEYPQFGSDYQVQHHSQFLADLLQEGHLKRPAQNTQTVTLHDPCYLARVNGEQEAPRLVLNSIVKSGLREMERRGKRTFCCGAGGGRMWFDEPPAKRVSILRAGEAFATGAKTLATGCPFCLNMMSDGVSSSPGGDHMEVLDLAELLDRSYDPVPRQEQACL